MDRDALGREALRLYLRYATEVVEPLGLCPWARRARLDGRVMYRIVVDPDPAPADLAPHLEAVLADERVEVGLVLLPRLEISHDDFRRYVATLRDIDAGQHAGLYMADFHPEAPLDATSPARLVAFIRCTPDPTVQLVRRTVLNAVRRNEISGTTFFSPEQIAAGAWHNPPAAPLHERIAEDNFVTVAGYGFDRMAALLADIRRDRDETYARLGVKTAS